MSNSTWCSPSSKKLLFFARLRRLLRRKMTPKKTTTIEATKTTMEEVEKIELAVVLEKKEVGISSFFLQRSVKKLLFGGMVEKELAAKEIGRLAAEDLNTRKSLAALGVIPALVSMLELESAVCRRSAIRALVELGSGTHA